MSMRSVVLLLTTCALTVLLLGWRGSVRAQDYPGPVGVEFGVEPPAAGATVFPCQIAVRSLMTGERILLDKFSAEPGKETKFRKSSKGFDVEVEVTITPGGSSVSYSTLVATATKTVVGIHSARLKLRN
jgi:hypothetical protein